MSETFSVFDVKFLVQTLTPSALSKIKNQIHLKEFKRGQRIYVSGDSPGGIYFITKGLVGLMIQTSVGKEHLVRLFGKDQFFGHRSILANEDYHGDALALEPTLLTFMPRAAFEELLVEHPQILFRISKTMARELRRCEIKFATQTDQDVTLRVIATILYLLKMHPEHCWTRKEIAEFCGSTAPTVIKVLAKLEAAQLISQEGREIRILDLEQMELQLNSSGEK